jgi:hypothetical protein
LSLLTPQLESQLPPIPAFHQDLLHLLPGGQAYLDAAAAVVAQQSPGNAQKQAELCWEHIRMYRTLLSTVISRSTARTGGCEALPSDAPVLSPAAVLLTLELQLLAAAAVQQQRQLKEQPTKPAGFLSCDLHLTQNNHFLLRQLTAATLATGSSCLPPEVLQQAGLPLLQALAAPLQQLQLSSPDDQMYVAALQGHGRLQEQLYALRAAAGGMRVAGSLTVGECWGRACCTLCQLVLQPHTRTAAV